MGHDHGHKSCRETVELFLDYLEGRLPAEDQAELDLHFTACPPCHDILRSYRAVPDICRDATAATIPAEVADRLHRFLADKRSRK